MQKFSLSLKMFHLLCFQRTKIQKLPLFNRQKKIEYTGKLHHHGKMYIIKIEERDVLMLLVSFKAISRQMPYNINTGRKNT